MAQPSASGSPNLEAVTVTHTGRVRKNNEDNAGTFLVAHPRLGLLHLWIVADGMGGGAKGEVASRVAVDATNTFLSNARWDSPGEALKQAIEHANREVHREGSGDGVASRSVMGTTITAALVSDRDGKFWIGNVGDSRAYLQKRDGPVLQLTRDHSLVRERVEAGIITESEARTSQDRNVVTRALGIDSKVTVDVAEGVEPLTPGDRLILASDGMHGMVGQRGIVSVASKAQKHIDLADNLVKAALRAGGQDNVTVVAGGYADGSTMTVEELPTQLDLGVPSSGGNPRKANFVALAAVAVGVALVLAVAVMLAVSGSATNWPGLPGRKADPPTSATPGPTSATPDPSRTTPDPASVSSGASATSTTSPENENIVACPSEQNAAVNLAKCRIPNGYTCSELGEAVQFPASKENFTSLQALSIVLVLDNEDVFPGVLDKIRTSMNAKSLPCIDTQLFQAGKVIVVPTASDIQAEFRRICDSGTALNAAACK